VNQVTLWGLVKTEDRVSLKPELHLGAGHSFGRDRWLYEAGLVQPLFEERALELGGSVYRRNATPDSARISDAENSLFAFLFREDWHDHYETEGAAGFVTLHASPSVRFGLHAKAEEHRSVATPTDWGLYTGPARRRANAPIDDGTLRSIGASWLFDNRDDDARPSRGWLACAAWEWAGGRLGGDFAFQRGTADVRHYLKLSPHHYFDVRLLGGLLTEASRDSSGGELRGLDAVPVQERFYLGGTGTLRATQFKSISGDRVVLANAELRMDVLRDLQLALFTDLGDSWADESGSFDLKTDAGIGIQDGDGDLRLDIARKMDGRPGGNDVTVSARLRRMF
jgi:outer membrane protein assembly factor BamA